MSSLPDDVPNTLSEEPLIEPIMEFSQIPKPPLTRRVTPSRLPISRLQSLPNLQNPILTRFWSHLLLHAHQGSNAVLVLLARTFNQAQSHKHFRYELKIQSQSLRLRNSKPCLVQAVRNGSPYRQHKLRHN